MNIEEAIRARRSIKTYDPDETIDDAELRAIFDLVTQSPSSFNLQHWRFVVVRDLARRKELRAAAFGQPHLEQAPVVVVIAAKLAAHEDAARANGHAPPEVLDNLVPMIERYYASNPQFQRDEAIRSASLAAMTLMLVAQSRGLATCPMIGFDPAKAAAIVNLDDRHIPVMLMCLGRSGEGEPFPTSRFDLSEVVKLEALDGEGLQ